jgi:hypothetical protein
MMFLFLSDARSRSRDRRLKTFRTQGQRHSQEHLSLGIEPKDAQKIGTELLLAVDGDDYHSCPRKMGILR